MTFKRRYKLLPYWNKWYSLMEKARKGLETETTNLTIDGVSYGFGGQSVTIPPEAVSKFIKEDLAKIYHKGNLALKVFYKHSTVLSEEISNTFWGESFNIVDVSKIQNIFSIFGLSPKVYDLVSLIDKNVKYIAQVTDFVEGERENDVINYQELANVIAEKSEYLGVSEGDVSMANFVERQFLDFGRFLFGINYRDKLRLRMNNLGFGTSEMPYQSIPRLQIVGTRDVLKRAKVFEKAFKKDRKLLPKDFTVIDYGCNSGFFLREAFDWGAVYGVGVEREELLDAVAELSYFLRYFNIDFVSKLPQKQFDLAFFLSMDQHVNFEEFLPCVGKVLYFEGHNIEEPERKYLSMLKDFKEVEILGKSHDFGERLLIRAIR